MACSYLYFSFGFGLLISKRGKGNAFWAELEACSLTLPCLCFLGPLMKCDFWICCSSIISMSNMALSCHFRIELRKNQAGEENSYPSIYLRGGEGSNGNNKVASQRFLSFFLPPLIQNIILYYCGRTRRHILRSGDSLSFPENTMDRRSPCEVADLPPDQVQAKLLPSHSVFPESQQVLTGGKGLQGGWLPTSPLAKSQGLRAQADELSRQAFPQVWERGMQSRWVESIQSLP